MIWFFERRRAWLHYEIRRQTDGPNYELVVTHPDGRQEVERYGDSAAVADRANRLERTLIDDGWARPPMGPRAAGRGARAGHRRPTAPSR
jgi:hypothetical protein